MYYIHLELKFVNTNSWHISYRMISVWSCQYSGASSPYSDTTTESCHISGWSTLADWETRKVVSDTPRIEQQNTGITRVDTIILWYDWVNGQHANGIIRYQLKKMIINPYDKWSDYMSQDTRNPSSNSRLKADNFAPLRRLEGRIFTPNRFGKWTKNQWELDQWIIMGNHGKSMGNLWIIWLVHG